MSKRYPSGFISTFYDPLKNPDAPTIGTAEAGDSTASVPFTAPSNVGGSAITGYGVQSTPEGIKASAASSPISVTGLTNGTPYTFAVWAINSYGTGPFSAASNSVTPAVPPFGILMGGVDNTGSYTSAIRRITLDTSGTVANFGNMTTPREKNAGVASSTRAITMGGYGSGFYSSMEYVTIATTGNGTFFGNLSRLTMQMGGTGNETRGLSICGWDTNVGGIATISYVTIATTGSSTSFGSWYNGATYNNQGACSSPTRALYGGGVQGGLSKNVIGYLTIATTGGGTAFGELTSISAGGSACSNSTRGVFAHGGYSNILSYVTIATEGNSTSFGSLTNQVQHVGALSTTTRGFFVGGNASGTGVNVIQYITFASTGNAIDIGDLPTTLWDLAACSSAHGGLQ